jgi:hypothetical protein
LSRQDGASHLAKENAVMTYYKHSQYFSQDNSADFDKTFAPGTPTPYSGVYRCEVCGHEAVSTKSHPLPPEHHAKNAVNQRTKWRLIAASHPV